MQMQYTLILGAVSIHYCSFLHSGHATSFLRLYRISSHLHTPTSSSACFYGACYTASFSHNHHPAPAFTAPAITHIIQSPRASFTAPAVSSHLIHPIHPIHPHLLCICEPRDASARSFNRLHSVHTIMIFVVPASTDHHVLIMVIKTPDDHNHSQETKRDQLGVYSQEPRAIFRIRLVICAHCSP